MRSHMATFALRSCAALLLMVTGVLAQDPSLQQQQQLQLQLQPQQPQQQDLRCFSPAGQETTCVKLNACRPLLDLLRQGRGRLPAVEMRGAASHGGNQSGRAGLPDPEATAILRRSHCGFQGNTVMVCCPPDDLQSYPRAKQPTADRYDEMSVSFSGPAAYPGHPEPQPGPPTGQPQDLQSASAYAPSGSSAPQEPPALGASPSSPSTSASHPHAPPPGVTVLTSPELTAPLDAEHLALLPMEICGLSAQPQERPEPANRTALLQYPWMARLGYRQADGTVEYFCSGSLISERYVLTAAHCIRWQNGPTSVRLGEQDAETDPDCSASMCAPNVLDMDIEETSVHERYGHGINDIALIRLMKPVTFTEAASPVCLPVPDKPVETLVGKSLTVTGWGKSAPNRRFHAPSRWLLQTRVAVADEGTCRSAYSGADDVEFSSAAHLCVGGQQHSPCQGDSGSPLVQSEPRRGPGPSQRVVQHGLLSFGLPDCVLRSAPVVYTRVAHFLPWIVTHMEPAPFVPKDVTSGSGYVDPRREGR